MKFSYEKYPSIEGATVLYPTLNVGLVNPKTKKTISAYKVLVDSGAAGCVFHGLIGEVIGLDVTSGEELPMSGVTKGNAKQYLHPVIIEIGGNKIDLVVGFSYDLSFPFGLLGQLGFFEKFRVCFDQPVGDFEITPKTQNK